MEYTKKEFASIRKHLENIFDDLKLDGYRVRKSTYNWSKNNNWLIEVSISLAHKKVRYSDPEALLEMVVYMFSKVNGFVHDKKYNFHFKNVHSKGDFGFSFTFQPIAIAAKEMLNGLFLHRRRV